MKILVTGANGMLGTALCPELKRLNHTVWGIDLNDEALEGEKIDITDFNQLRQYVDHVQPDAIFHLAAETDVDLCEKKPDHAYKVNTLGTENVVLICQTYNLLMIYISTAGVFNGQKPDPYTEFDQPDPANIYGKTKLEGEGIVQNLLNKYFIIRAGWMIGGGKKDKKFVAKIVNLLKQQNEIKIVSDKLGSPTFTEDLSQNIMPLVDTKRYGLYHMANQGTCSRFDIALKIVKYLNREKDVKIYPVNSAEFPLPAPRARSEMMRNYKLDLLGMNHMPHWEDALQRYLVKNVTRK
jgi:dTDP-4-dehydrorhamnose reductase